MFEAFEIFFSGTSTFVSGPLRPDEEALLGRVLQKGESVERYVRGRGERVGWVLWVLTPNRLLCINLKGKRPPRELAHEHVTRVEAIRGKWGGNLFVHAGDIREEIFAADPALGDAFMEALVGYRPTLSAPSKLVVPEPPPEPQFDARLRAYAPSPTPPAVDPSQRLMESMREAAALREKGLLSDEEFAALKRKLLGG
jgi:hypothetical protein